MKRTFLLFCVHVLVGFAMAQYPKGEPLIPVYPELEEKGSFSMIMVPDPQCYVKFEANQPLFDLQTAWIAQNIREMSAAPDYYKLALGITRTINHSKF